MTARIERARWLGERLREHLIALGGATRGVDALHFLDRLARLEALPAEELAEAGLSELVATAAATRASRAPELGRIAGESLDLERFLELGRHLPPDPEDPARQGWLRDLLLIATVLPWLPPARGNVASEALDQALALVEADAEGFLAASSVATDRREHEQPQGWPSQAREALQVLTDLPLLVLFDRADDEPDEARVQAALALVDEATLEEAEDALLDRDLFRALLRRPAAGAGVTLYAADEESVALCRMFRGVWTVHARAGGLALRWSPLESAELLPISAELLSAEGSGSLDRDAEGLFLLPAGALPATLRLRVGPDSRTLLLTPSES